MMYLLSFGLVFAGFMIGWHVREWFAQQKINLMLRHVQSIMERERETEEGDHRKIMHLSVSKEGDYLLVHDKNTGKFLCQAKTHSELTEILNEKFANTRFMVDRNELKDTGYEDDSL